MLDLTDPRQFDPEKLRILGSQFGFRVSKQNKIIIQQQQEIEMYKEINKSIHIEYKKKAQIIFNEILSHIGKRG